MSVIHLTWRGDFQVCNLAEMQVGPGHGGSVDNISQRLSRHLDY